MQQRAMKKDLVNESLHKWGMWRKHCTPQRVTVDICILCCLAFHISCSLCLFTASFQKIKRHKSSLSLFTSILCYSHVISVQRQEARRWSEKQKGKKALPGKWWNVSHLSHTELVCELAFWPHWLLLTSKYKPWAGGTFGNWGFL